MKDLKSLIFLVIFKYIAVSWHWIGGKTFWNRNNVFFTLRLKKQIFFMTSNTFQSSTLHLWYITTSSVPFFSNASEALMVSLVLSVLCPLSGCGISSFSFWILISVSLSQTVDTVRKQDLKKAPFSFFKFISFFFFERQRKHRLAIILERRKNNENIKTQIRCSLFFLVLSNSWVWSQAKVELFLRSCCWILVLVSIVNGILPFNPNVAIFLFSRIILSPPLSFYP